MARSSYIYCVFYEGELQSAFTVKHEMIESLPKNWSHKHDIFRLRDGNLNEDKVDITQEIKEQEYS